MNPAAAPSAGAWMSSLTAVIVVLALFAAAAWLFKRSRLGGIGRRDRISIETACSIGERRSLVIVGVEGRRLLLGVTPGQVSLLTELGAQPGGFGPTLDRAVAGPGGGLQASPAGVLPAAGQKES